MCGRLSWPALWSTFRRTIKQFDRLIDQDRSKLIEMNKQTRHINGTQQDLSFGIDTLADTRNHRYQLSWYRHRTFAQTRRSADCCRSGRCPSRRTAVGCGDVRTAQRNLSTANAFNNRDRVKTIECIRVVQRRPRRRKMHHGNPPGGQKLRS